MLQNSISLLFFPRSSRPSSQKHSCLYEKPEIIAGKGYVTLCLDADNMSRQYLTIGVNGLVEAAQFMGIDINDNPEIRGFCAGDSRHD